jgi:hypothetical protein
MRIRHLALGIAVLLLTGIVGTANAKTQKINCNFSASFTDGVETNIDTNGDGVSATLAQGINNCSFGRFLIQVESELVPALSATTCSAGTVAYQVVQNHSVWTEESSGDQMFWAVTPDTTFCLDVSQYPNKLSLTYSGQANVTGGTGKFAEATGTVNLQGTGTYLAFGAKNGVFGGFGQLSETESGTLNLPRGGKGKDD